MIPTSTAPPLACPPSTGAVSAAQEAQSVSLSHLYLLLLFSVQYSSSNSSNFTLYYFPQMAHCNVISLYAKLPHCNGSETLTDLSHWLFNTKHTLCVHWIPVNCAAAGATFLVLHCTGAATFKSGAQRAPHATLHCPAILIPAKSDRQGAQKLILAKTQILTKDTSEQKQNWTSRKFRQIRFQG